MSSKKITVYGLVQGVGFRPFVAELCKELNITGTVKNTGGIVTIEASGEDSSLVLLRQKLESLTANNQILPGSRVDEIEEVEIDNLNASKMRIVESSDLEEEIRFLPPDIATCPRCEKELLDPANRRYRYPFISCFSCGPRYTIMDAVPYDREHTTMKAFPLCGDCESDYEEFGNPRHFAQTIACEKCGPKLFAYEVDQVPEDPLARAVQVLRDGGLVAIKDIGGYHIAFDPYNEEAAQRLRALKHRERKPFAVMFPDMDSIRAMCEANEKEEELLTSEARPIVLLRRSVDSFAPGVCGTSDNIGAMLPCNPLQILLLKECGPLVMTSANRGGEPMIIDDDKMCEMLKTSHTKDGDEDNDGIDLVLANDREILQGLDDSVCQVFGDKVQFIRRARGYVPTPIILKNELSKETFAAGGDLKSVFAFGKKRFAYLSGHYGDLEEYAAYLAMQNGVKHFKDLFGFHEEQIVYDMHPSYASSKYAKKLINNNTSSDGINADGKAIQHHHAHVASVIAEHGLEGKVLGVAFDGTGYGTDGTIWGGEFLLCDVKGGTFERVGHLKSVEMTGGDAMAKNADIPAMCYLYEAEQNGYLNPEDNPYSAASKTNVIVASLDNHINTVKNSSAGRLFDAVAAVLDLCHENSYEGECPNVLQTAAEHFDGELHMKIELPIRIVDGKHIADTPYLIKEILREKQNGTPVEELAYAFHVSLTEATSKIIQEVCTRENVTQVALSGGTFYNRLLLREIFKRLENTSIKTFINEQVPSGDGGLALGQLFLTL